MPLSKINRGSKQGFHCIKIFYLLFFYIKDCFSQRTCVFCVFILEFLACACLCAPVPHGVLIFIKEENIQLHPIFVLERKLKAVGYLQYQHDKYFLLKHANIYVLTLKANKTEKQ